MRGRLEDEDEENNDEEEEEEEEEEESGAGAVGGSRGPDSLHHGQDHFDQQAIRIRLGYAPNFLILIRSIVKKHQLKYVVVSFFVFRI